MRKARIFNICLSATLVASLLISCNSEKLDDFVVNSITAQDGTVVDINSIAVAPEEDFEYVISDSKAMITSYIGTAQDVSIPSEIDGAPVTALLSDVFYADEDLRAVIIPEGVTTIKDSVFYDCSSLIYVELPSTLTDMGENVFANCVSLESLVLPNRVSEIPNRCFYGCTSLNSVTMGSSVTKIGDYAFASCDAIYGMTISNAITHIGEFAFFQCADLNVIEFTGQTAFEKTSFLQCESLVVYTLKDSIPYSLASEYGLTVAVKNQ